MRLNGRKSSERGATTVEFALLAASVLIPLLVGVADFGQIIHTRHILNLAAREGAITASRGTDPTAIVRQHLSQAGLDAGRATVTPTGTNGTLGTEVSVRVAYDLSGMPIIPWDGLVKNLASLEASAFARHR